MRLLQPDTTRRLLSRIVMVPGIRRILLNGQNLPLVIPYGPARGLKNAHPDRRKIWIAGNTVDLHVQVGTITLEVLDVSVISEVRAICDDFFIDFPCQVQEGQFMKTIPSIVDYAKHGPSADRNFVGLSDPRRGGEPVVLKIPKECGGDL